MLDRLELLNNLLKNTTEIQKSASEEDDDFDIPLYAPPVKPISPEKKPVSFVMEPESAAKAENIAPTPAQPAAPVQKPIPQPVVTPVVVPSITPIPTEKSSEKTEEAPQKRELPTWFSPDWKPIRKIKIEEDFPTSHWSKFEDEPQEVSLPESEKVENIDIIQKPKMSADEALVYLESLPEEQHLSDALTALNYLDEELSINSKNKKLISTVLALTIAQLKGLIEHADIVFGVNKEQALPAVEVLIENTESEIKKLPQRFQERTEKELFKAIEGRKRGPVRELTSQWYGPKLIFINNRAIRLLKTAGISIDEAEKTAQDEWESILETINELAPDYEEKNKSELLKLGAQKLLSGASLEDANKLISQHIEAINAGIITAESISMEDDQLKKLFPDIKVDPNEDWEENFAKDMSDEDFVKGNLTDSSGHLNLPEDLINKLSSEISLFGKQALKFSKLNDAIKRGIDEDKMVEADDALQIIYDNIETLARQIFVINPKYLENPLVHDMLGDVYIVFKSVRAEAKEQGLESVSDRSISPAESSGEGLGIDPAAPNIKETDPRFSKQNPRHKRPDESPEEYNLRKSHEKELADSSRYRYLQRMLANGDALGYLERKRQYRLEQRPKETTKQYRDRIRTENEMDRIRKPEYKKNKQELVKWRYLATKNPKTTNEKDLKDQIKSLLLSQENRTNDLFQRIESSWLPETTISEIENDLLNTRLKNFQNEYNTINNLEGMNKLVLSAMEYSISQIPRYFEEAKEKIKYKKNSLANITLDMVSAFQKYSFE